MYKHAGNDILRTCSEDCARKLNTSAWRYKNMPKERENQKKWRRDYSKRLKERHVKLLTVQIPEEYWEVMEELCKLGRFKNKSEFTQKAIDSYFWELVECDKIETNQENIGRMETTMIAGDKKCE